jgi:hypothetical protein
MDLYEMFGVDGNTAQSGVRFQFGKENDTVWVEARFAGKENKAFYNALIAHQEKYKNFNQKGKKLSLTIEDEQAAADYAKIIADTIFVAWNGFTDRGEPVPNTKEAFYKFLLKYERFAERLIELITDVSNFQSETEAKN